MSRRGAQKSAIPPVAPATEMSGLSPSALEIPLGPGALGPAPLAPLIPVPPLLTLLAVPPLPPPLPLPLPLPLPPPLPLPAPPPPPLVPPPPPCANAAGAPEENSMEAKIGKTINAWTRRRAQAREARPHRDIVVSPIRPPA